MAEDTVDRICREGHCREFLNIEFTHSKDAVALQIKDFDSEELPTRLFLPRCLCPDKSNYSAQLLRQALEKKHSSVLLALVGAGSDVMATDSVHGETALHRACFNQNLEFIVLLVQQGAAVNVFNNIGQTPLDKLLYLCIHPWKDSTTRSRLLTAHLLTRLGFKVSPKSQSQRPGVRRRVLMAYNKAKICSECPSLLHLCRLRVRELLPERNLVPVIKSLPVPVDLHSFLLFRPAGLDHHVTCSHVEGLIQGLNVTHLERTERCSHFKRSSDTRTARQN